MDNKDIQFINEYIYRMFLPIMSDSLDSGEVANALTEEVTEDIAECADPDGWTSEDIRMGVARVLKKKLNID